MKRGKIKMNEYFGVCGFNLIIKELEGMCHFLGLFPNAASTCSC